MQTQVTLHKVPGGHVMLSIVDHTGILQGRCIQSCKVFGRQCFITCVELGVQEKKDSACTLTDVSRDVIIYMLTTSGDRGTRPLSQGHPTFIPGHCSVKSCWEKVFIFLIKAKFSNLYSRPPLKKNPRLVHVNFYIPILTVACGSALSL